MRVQDTLDKREMRRSIATSISCLKTISTVRLLPRIILIFTYFIDKSMLNPKIGRKLGVSELIF